MENEDRDLSESDSEPEYDSTQNMSFIEWVKSRCINFKKTLQDI